MQLQFSIFSLYKSIIHDVKFLFPSFPRRKFNAKLHGFKSSSGFCLVIFLNIFNFVKFFGVLEGEGEHSKLQAFKNKFRGLDIFFLYKARKMRKEGRE